MSFILNIDTATEIAGLYLSKDGKIIEYAMNENQNDHASWIHTAIVSLLSSAKITAKNLNAVAVIAGPGSYTGIRVGMATAKGLCYALSIPLITENTLKVMAASLFDIIHTPENNKPFLVCPMIDARRSEVFMAVYDKHLDEIIPPKALILIDKSFEDELINNSIYFFGNGSTKWEKICHHPNAYYEKRIIDGKAMAALSYVKFLQNEFTTLAYSEPVYLKEFYTHPK